MLNSSARGSYFVTVTLTGTFRVKLPAVTVTLIVEVPSGVPVLFEGLVILALVQPEMPASTRARSNPAE